MTAHSGEDAEESSGFLNTAFQKSSNQGLGKPHGSKELAENEQVSPSKTHTPPNRKDGNMILVWRIFFKAVHKKKNNRFNLKRASFTDVKTLGNGHCFLTCLSTLLNEH